jgi:hypothetical protein
MGNKCGCGAKEEPWSKEQIDSIVKIQSNIRTHLAVKERESIKSGKLEDLFSKFKTLINH